MQYIKKSWGSQRVKAHLAITMANLMFGVNYAVAKGVMPIYLLPFAFTLLRVITASFFFG